MTSEIGKILIDTLQDLPFVDRYAGVVQTITKSGDGGKTKKFPVSCQTSMEECDTGRYIDLIPNTVYRSVMYLEDRGIRFLKKQGGVIFFKAQYDLICWLNLPKLGFDGCSYSAAAMAGIISEFPEFPFNSPGYQQIMINIQGQQPKSFNPFAKYSYDEAVTQFLMHPYDYFALNFDVDFGVHVDCLRALPLEEEDPCLTINPVINYAKVKDQDGNIVKILKAGEVYNVIIASGIDEGGPDQEYTILVTDIN